MPSYLLTKKKKLTSQGADQDCVIGSVVEHLCHQLSIAAISTPEQSLAADSVSFH